MDTDQPNMFDDSSLGLPSVKAEGQGQSIESDPMAIGSEHEGGTPSFALSSFALNLLIYMHIIGFPDNFDDFNDNDDFDHSKSELQALTNAPIVITFPGANNGAEPPFTLTSKVSLYPLWQSKKR